MANPYYIQPQRNPMFDVMNMGMQLYGMRQKQALGEKELAMKGKQFDLGEKEHLARIEQNRATNVREDKRLNIEQGKADFEKKKWTQTNATITPISDADWTKQKISWQTGLEEQGYDPKSVKEFFENFDPMQEQGQLTPRVGLSKLTTEREKLIKPWLNAEQKKLDKLIADGYSPDSLQVNQAIERISFLKSDKLPMSFFPRAYIAEMQSQKAHQRALELRAVGGAQPRLYPTTEGYQDRAGALGKLAPKTPGRLYPTEKGYLPGDQAKGLGKAETVKTVSPQNVVDAAKELRNAQFNKDGSRREEVNQSDLAGVRAKLKGTGFELKEETTPKVVKDYWPDTPAKTTYVIRKSGTAGTTKAATPKATPKIQTYRTAEEVRQAVKKGQITKAQAISILQSQFGYE